MSKKATKKELKKKLKANSRKELLKKASVKSYVRPDEFKFETESEKQVD